MSKEFAAETRDRIDDSQTYNNFSHYGATYSLVEDHGTAHINVLAANGDAVSVTSTINNIFGSKIVSRSTGIILNDEMDDFSTPGKSNSYGVPASVANFIKPGKRPLSSMCPIIILDEHKNVRLLIGGAGGIKITSSVAYVSIDFNVICTFRITHFSIFPIIDHCAALVFQRNTPRSGQPATSSPSADANAPRPRTWIRSADLGWHDWQRS